MNDSSIGAWVSLRRSLLRRTRTKTDLSIMSVAEKIEVHIEVERPKRAQACSRNKLFGISAILLGLLCGGLWFMQGYSVPETLSAWHSGDPHDYVRGSVRGYKKVFYYATWRSFGYPFYLSLFRELFPGESAFRLPAFLLQYVCYLASSWFLFSALNRAGMRIPVIALALLFAHPAFAGLAGIPMTEALTTAMYSCVFGLGILLLHNGKRLLLRGALFGACLGLVICMRPPALGFIGMITMFTGLAYGVRRFTQTRRLVSSLGSMTGFFFVVAIAFAPFIGHTLNNCWKAYGTTCMVQPGLARSGMKESLSFRANRVWYSPLPSPGTVVFCSNVAPIFGDCTFSKEDPIGDMLACYQKHYAALPVILGERLLGLFDHRHIHSYANRETSEAQSLVIRAFSATGLVGLLAVIMIWCFSVLEGRGAERVYLLFPVVYLAGQINFHPDSRYLLPVVPMLFLFGVSAIVTNQFSRRWQTGMFVICSCLVVGLYALKVTQWDAEIKNPVCRTGFQLPQQS